MAFDKTKALATAQDYVTRGKIPAAIQEYLTILKRDPKDLNLLNTVGDLYVRTNQVAEALQHFYKLGDAYVADGFLMRAIAIYKKIVKVDPNAVQAMEKLAELYVLQGLLNEARSQYLQLAEFHLKANRTDPALAVFQKMLELEPENVTVQNRLADLYQKLGKKGEAVSIYLGAADRLIQRDDYLEATKLIDKALKLDGKNVTAQVLKARCELQLAQASEAVARLQAIPGYEEQGPVVEVLLEAFIAQDRLADARNLAHLIIAKHPERYGGVFTVATHEVELGEHEGALQLLQEITAIMVAQREVERLATVVRQIAAALPSNPAPLELLVDINRRAGDVSFLADSLAKLAKCHADLQQYDKARPLCEELVKLEPTEPEHGRLLNTVLEKLGIKPEAAPAVAVMEELGLAREEEAAAPAAVVGEVALDEATQAFVTGALTDADLYSSYGSAQKAIDLLEQVVAKVPNHTGAHEKLLDLYVGAGKATKISAAATRLADIYRSRGDKANADKFTEMAERYAKPAAVPVEAAATHEVDLSAEWETAEAPAAAVAEVNWNDVREEIAFYISQNMFQEAQQALGRLEPAHGGRPEFRQLSEQLTSAEAASAAAPAEAVAAGETTSVIEFGIEVPAEAAPAEFAVAPAGGTQEFTFEAPVEEEEPVAAEPAAAEEAGETFEVTLEAVPTTPEPAPAAAAGGFLDELAGDLDQALGGLGATGATAAPPPPPTPAAKAAPPKPPKAAPPAVAPGALSSLLEEFKEELGEIEEAEDPETHYNLGIAYREMGLFDEAISEFQKVVKASEHQPYASILQCFTLLALCFMEKGMPKIAVRWYDRALKIPGLDEEGAMALRYDMGVGYEAAGEKEAALDCFTEVYSSNIDYRDVADRIRILQKEIR